MTSRTSNVYAIVIAALLATSPSVLAAQARPLSLPERLSPSTRSALQLLVDSLERERLPAYAVADKAAEGVLKGADDARIVSAARALAQRLRTARQLLGEEARADELLATSSALFAGVPPEAISRFVNTPRGRRASASLSVPMSIIAELATARVPADVATSTVGALLAGGAADADLRAFRTVVDRDIRQGRAPRDAATAGLQQTLRGLDRVP